MLQAGSPPKGEDRGRACLTHPKGNEQMMMTMVMTMTITTIIMVDDDDDDDDDYDNDASDTTDGINKNCVWLERR